VSEKTAWNIGVAAQGSGEFHFNQLKITVRGGRDFTEEVHPQRLSLPHSVPCKDPGRQLSERERRLALAHKLNEDMIKGQELLRTCLGATPPSDSAQWWEKLVETRIEEHLGEAVMLEWSKEYPVTPFPGAAVNRGLVDRLYTRLQRLGEIVSRLTTD
jgi:hypothetical protein